MRLRGRKNWIQARKDDIQLIYDTKEEADQVVIDYTENIKQTNAVNKAKREDVMEKLKIEKEENNAKK